MMKYRTIVADPPWRYDEGWPVGKGQALAHAHLVGEGFEQGRRTALKYAAMSVAEISALPVEELAEPNAHLYLWTTNRYLFAAFDVLVAWGFHYGQTLVWAKTPMGLGPGGTWAQNVEYIVFARRGSLKSLRRLDTCWFNWPRTAIHSKKPEHFRDMVETVSPGPYLELFARTQRLGWDTWGNEALCHVTLDDP